MYICVCHCHHYKLYFLHIAYSTWTSFRSFRGTPFDIVSSSWKVGFRLKK